MISDKLSEILPAAQAFKDGELQMAETVTQAVAGASGNLSIGIVTSIFMVLFVALTIFTLVDFIRMLPLLLDSYTRKNSSLNIEHNIQTSRERNLAAFTLALPFCLLANLYDFYTPGIILFVNKEWRALVLLGVLGLYVLLRYLMSGIVRKPYHIRFDDWRAVQRGIFSYFILMVVLLGISIGIMVVFKSGDKAIRVVSYCEMGFIYLLSFFRCGNILKDYCSGFGTFLYLCALEIIPTGALVASATFL